MKEEYTHKELKQLHKEYYDNKKQIKTLIENTEILTEAGTNKYYKIKARQHTIKEILANNGVKV